MVGSTDPGRRGVAEHSQPKGLSAAGHCSPVVSLRFGKSRDPCPDPSRTQHATIPS